MRRIIPLALGFAFSISGGLLLWEAHMPGFPDRNISEVDRVLLPYNLLVAFGFLTLVCAALSLACLPACKILVERMCLLHNHRLIAVRLIFV